MRSCRMSTARSFPYGRISVFGGGGGVSLSRGVPILTDILTESHVRSNFLSNGIR